MASGVNSSSHNPRSMGQRASSFWRNLNRRVGNVFRRASEFPRSHPLYPHPSAPPLPPAHAPLTLGRVHLVRGHQEKAIATGDLSSLPHLSELREDEIIETLKAAPQLAELYTKDTGVGYTVEEHTQNVIAFAQKHRAALESNISHLMTWKEFLLFLALHDIGKGVAVELQKEQAPSPIQAKEDELRLTREVIAKVVASMDVKPQTATLYQVLLESDLQGEYLREIIGKENVIYKLTLLSHEAQIPMKDLYSLIVVFHKCDAGAYPELACDLFREETCEFEIETEQDVKGIFERIDLVDQGRALVRAQDLTQEEELVTNFLNALPSVIAYMTYRYRCLLVDLQAGKKGGQKEANLLEIYFRDLTKKSIEMGISQVDVDTLYELLTGEDIHSQLEDYLRSSREITRDQLAHSIELFDLYLLFVQSLKEEAYLRLTVHGTNSHILPNLELTNHTLYPSLVISRKGNVPLTGELGPGTCAFDGVNRFSLSCTDTTGIEKAVSYAHPNEFVIRQSRYIELFEKRIKTWERMAATTAETEVLDFIGAIDLSSFSWMLARLRIIAPQFLEENLDRFSNAFIKYKKLWEQFKRSKLYQQHMTRSTELWPGTKVYGTYPEGDLYYENSFKNLESTLKVLPQRLEQDLFVPDLEPLQKERFSIVWGSTNTHSSPLNGSERKWEIPMRLGKEINVAFTTKEHQKELEGWLQSRGIFGVTVKDSEELKEIQKVAESALKASLGELFNVRLTASEGEEAA